MSRLYSLISVSRYGMTEEELQLILGMQPADWSPFFLACRETLSISGGRHPISPIRTQTRGLSISGGGLPAWP